MHRHNVQQIADLLTDDPDILNEMLPIAGRDPLTGELHNKPEPPPTPKKLEPGGKDPSKQQISIPSEFYEWMEKKDIDQIIRKITASYGVKKTNNILKIAVKAFNSGGETKALEVLNQYYNNLVRAKSVKDL